MAIRFLVPLKYTTSLFPTVSTTFHLKWIRCMVDAVYSSWSALPVLLPSCYGTGRMPCRNERGNGYGYLYPKHGVSGEQAVSTMLRPPYRQPSSPTVTNLSSSLPYWLDFLRNFLSVVEPLKQKTGPNNLTFRSYNCFPFLHHAKITFRNPQILRNTRSRTPTAGRTLCALLSKIVRFW